MNEEDRGVPVEPSGQAGQNDAALHARMASLEGSVAALAAEMSSIRTQLAALGWTRVAASAPPSHFAPSPQPGPILPVISQDETAPALTAQAAPGYSAPALRSLQGLGSRPAGVQSLESQLGSRVLSKVAVALLLAGTAWFLKWAFDNRWVDARGRVVIGLLAGAAVVVWSERFRRQSMAAFSYALKAVGTGVLYLSLWGGFQLYHLMPAWVALLAMIAVTATNAVLAFSQESQLLMGYALLGAYLTPALLSTGGNHEIFLFTYLLCLAISTTALVRLRPWQLLLCGALPMTVAYYIAWYTMHFHAEEQAVTLLFSVLLWAAFAIAPVLAKENDSTILDVLVPLGAAAFGSLAVYSVLADSGGRAWEPWWALLFAAVYLGLMRLRRGGVVGAIHLSLAVVFLTITIPLKATGRGITIGWLAEAVVLLWVATLPQAVGSSRRALRLLGCTSLLLGVAGALIGPALPFDHTGPAFFNRDFATSLGALVALVSATVVSLRGENGKDFGRTIAVASLIAGNLVLLVAMGREIHNLYLHSDAASWASASEHADFTFSAWLMVQGIANLVAGFFRRQALARWAGLLLLGVTLIKVFAYDMRSLGTGYHVLSYLGLGVVLMAVSFAYQKDWLGLREAVASDEPAALEDRS